MVDDDGHLCLLNFYGLGQPNHKLVCDGHHSTTADQLCMGP